MLRYQRLIREDRAVNGLFTIPCQAVLPGIMMFRRFDPMSVERGRPRILVADDVGLNRQFASAVLAAANFDVDLVCDGFAACEAAATFNYDLILMDIEMPGMDGFEAATRIRARDQSVPIAAWTSTRRPHARELSKRSGMQLFITRPIEAKSLIQQVSCMLSNEAMSRDLLRKVTWQFSTFSGLAKRLGQKKMDTYLTHLAVELEAMASILKDENAAKDGLNAQIHNMISVAGLLGFERLSSLCSFIQANRSHTKPGDCWIDLSRAVDAAATAIGEYQRQGPPPHQH